MRSHFRQHLGLSKVLHGICLVMVCSLLFLLSGCGLVGAKTTVLTLETTPTSIQAGAQMVFTATISHNNGKFLGANWSITSNGTSCSACGTLTSPTNTGSQGNGDTSTITYTAPTTPPTPNSITIIATSVENPNSTGSDTFTITAVVSPLAVSTVTLASDGVGIPYLPVTLQATGGVSPYTWSIATGTGTLPAGLSLSSTGVISGTPTSGGTFTFSAQVQDSAATMATGNESITIAGPTAGAPQANITGLTVYPDSSDSHYTTVTTDAVAQIDVWGDKDSNGLVTSLRSLRVQGSNGTLNTFSFDSTGRLVRFSDESGTTFNLSWQSNTAATVVAYTTSGSAIAGPMQLTLSSAATAMHPTQSKTKSSPVDMSATALPHAGALPSNIFEVQVNRCGKPFDSALVTVLANDTLSVPRVSDASVTGSGTYDVAVPVTVPNSVIASTIVFCDSVADWFQPFQPLLQSWSNAKISVGQICMGLTAAAVVASDLAVLPAEAELDAACVGALGSLYEVQAVMSAVSPTMPSPYKNWCDTGIPAVANAINAATLTVSATVTIPGAPSESLGPYVGSSFPGSGLPPAVVNFDQVGICGIAGNWQGDWGRVDGQGHSHAGTLAATITDTPTPDTYDVALSVTDSNGTAGYSFSGVGTSETDIGGLFSFGPAVVDGVTGTAAGYLTPDGKALSGSFTGNAPGGSGGWSMTKQ